MRRGVKAEEDHAASSGGTANGNPPADAAGTSLNGRELRALVRSSHGASGSLGAQQPEGPSGGSGKGVFPVLQIHTVPLQAPTATIAIPPSFPVHLSFIADPAERWQRGICCGRAGRQLRRQPELLSIVMLRAGPSCGRNAAGSGQRTRIWAG